MSQKIASFILITLSALGILDSGYLTYEHYSSSIVPCPAHSLLLVDCGKVLKSEYAEIYGIPVALFGLLFYTSVFVISLILLKQKNIFLRQLLLIISLEGFLFSIYFVYIQLFILHAICVYCMFSAITSTLIFFLSVYAFWREKNLLLISIFAWTYQNIIKKILFMINPEIVHESMLSTGELMGKNPFVKKILSGLLVDKQKSLKQTVAGINFDIPIGLAAGFDYEAKLTQILPSVGFGFATVGTITNLAYEGNPKPMLGRLPKSKSLMVNKGFKNDGAESVAKKLSKLRFDYAQGISIGRSNSDKLKTQRQSVEDIIKAFKTIEKRKVKNSFYELNISCPNLIHGNVDFYTPKNLDELLKALDKLKLVKPVFIKMPIEKSDKEVTQMLNVISKHSPKGVIFGNLQKDRKHPSLYKDEVKKFNVGYFSGKPTYKRSNELIKLAYKKFGKKLVIIGTGGIFSANDAYTKIKLGASLVQLITGLIYQGPQLVSQINNGLAELLEKDGYTHISEAVGIVVK